VSAGAHKIENLVKIMIFSSFLGLLSSSPSPFFSSPFPLPFPSSLPFPVLAFPALSHPSLSFHLFSPPLLIFPSLSFSTFPFPSFLPLFHFSTAVGACVLPILWRFSKFVCVFLSVMLLNDKVCECHFAMKAFEYRNDFGSNGKGKVCSCPTCPLSR